jgi:ribonuclease HI
MGRAKKNKQDVTHEPARAEESNALLAKDDSYSAIKAMEGGKVLTLYCDGSARPNPGMGGLGIYGKDDAGNEFDIFGHVGNVVTNNRAELLAYIRVLELLLAGHWVEAHVYFDSRYVLDGAERHLRGWRKNGWKTKEGNAISNMDMWQTIDSLQQAVKQRKIRLVYHWVKGHSDDPGNERADQNANRGRLAAEKKIEELVIQVKGTEESTDPSVAEAKPSKPKPASYNKLISGKRLVFTTNTPMRTVDNRHIYLSANFDDRGGFNGKHFGTEAPDTLMSVLVTPNPVEQFEAIIEHQNAVTPDDFVQPVIMMMDRVTKPAIWEQLTIHGKAHLDHKRLNIVTVEGEPLTIYVRPPRRAYEGVDTLMQLLDQLERYTTNHSCTRTEYLDITEHLVTKGKKEWKLLKEIKGSDAAVTIPVLHGNKTISLTLTFNIDLPTRNHLNAVGKTVDHMKVVLVKYGQQNAGFRYAVIIEADEDRAIYASPFSNLKPTL